jgi:hypothetical protein
VQGFIALILAIKEADILRITVHSQLRQNFTEAPISINKFGVVVNVCYLSYWEVYLRALWSEACWGKTMATEIIFKK